MDFGKFFQGALPTLAANMTAVGSNGTTKGSQHGVMESLMPLLGLGGRSNPLVQALMLLYNLAGSNLGIDPTLILTILGFGWAGNKLWRQVHMAVYRVIQDYFTASIHISSSDEIFLQVMKWLAGQALLFNSRSLTAETESKTAWEGEEHGEMISTTIGADGSGIVLNFSTQEAKAPPRFVPALGMHGFWFEGRYFRLHRKQESFYDEGASSGMPQFKDKEKLVISCFGRSPEPIKKLLQHTKEQYYHDHYAKTTVKRPSPQNMRRYYGRNLWMVVANRPVRPIKTVVLDAKQKTELLTDVNEYLSPASPPWYANRGIPLRRGYLFHGPPGTGKTSLSFALAGIFGLDIHVISLLDPSLTEEDLSALFNTLPRRCVVLLEDIDAAGLSRPEGSENDKDKDGAGDSSKNDESKSSEWKVSDLARELKRHNRSEPVEKKGISLSGLLNAIDGVASHEGRVLIMTTNKPEELDEALIRPGRVDLQVGFANATRAQAEELFVRMYEADAQRAMPRRRPGGALEPVKTTSAPAMAPDSKNVSSASQGKTKDIGGRPPSPPESEKDTQEVVDEAVAVDESGGKDDENGHRALARIALAFAQHIPEGKFSPAEIQGFLLKRKKDPRRALAEVDSWATALLEQKASKTKVAHVQ